VIEPSLPGEGVNWVVQEAVDPLPLRVHGVGENEPELLGVVVKLTVPVGVNGVLLVSVTVTVHVVATLTSVDAGTQLTELDVDLSTVSELLPEEEMW
jgi:hypothetical protein